MVHIEAATSDQCLEEAIKAALNADERTASKAAWSSPSESGLSVARVPLVSSNPASPDSLFGKLFLWPQQQVAIESTLISIGLMSRFELQRVVVPRTRLVAVCRPAPATDDEILLVLVSDGAVGRTLVQCLEDQQFSCGPHEDVYKSVGLAIGEMQAALARGLPLIQLADLAVTEVLLEAPAEVPSSPPSTTSSDLLEEFVLDFSTDASRNDDTSGPTSKLLFGYRAVIEQRLSILPPDRKAEALAAVMKLFEVAAQSPHPRGLMHGDLSVSNVLFDRATNRIAIIDWNRAALSFVCDRSHSRSALETIWNREPCRWSGAHDPQVDSDARVLLRGHPLFDVIFLGSFSEQSGVVAAINDRLGSGFCESMASYSLPCSGFASAQWKFLGAATRLLLLRSKR